MDCYKFKEKQQFLVVACHYGTTGVSKIDRLLPLGSVNVNGTFMQIWV